MLIACLSPPEYKLQEGKSFVLFITVSPVSEESPSHNRYAHQMSLEFCYTSM